MLGRDEIYNLAEDAYRYYKNNAKRDQTCSYELACRKLTALIMNHFKRKDTGLGKIIYSFSGFNMIVNEETKTIEWVYWNRDDHKGKRPSKEKIEALKQTYVALGLNEAGTELLEKVKI